MPKYGNYILNLFYLILLLLHRKTIISAQNNEIESGGYLTSKFKNIAFQPTIELISYEIKKLAENINHSDKIDIIECVALSLGAFGLVVASLYFLHKLKLLQQKTVMI